MRTRNIFITLVLLAVGCAAPTPETPLPPAVTPSPVAPTFTPTLTDTPTVTQTVSPTITKTLTPSSTPTWTPWPTLSPQEAQDLVLELLETNGGCQYPCRWGIMPGETSWSEAKAFLTSFAFSFTVESTSERGVLRYSFFFPVPATASSSGQIFTDFYVRDEFIELIVFGREEKIATLLTEFGPPNEVWLRLDPIPPYPYSPEYLIALFYPDQGIMIGDISSSKRYPQGGSDFVGICREQLNDTHYGSLLFALWSPENQQDFMEFALYSRVLGFPSDRENYRLLNHVSSMDSQMFYEVFSYPYTSSCIEIPTESWPWGF